MSATEPVPGPFDAHFAEPAFGRSFLFLQGPVGGFFRELAVRVRAGGHRVHHINFNGGDRLFWRGSGAVDFRGGPYEWPGYLSIKLLEWRITDVVLFGDCRPLHRVAIAQARVHGLAVHVFEEGYLRPNWLTMEGGGVNGHSSLPRDADWFRNEAAVLAPWDGGTPVFSSFLRRSVEDVLYTLGLVMMAPLFRGYRTHRPWHPLVEYRAGARRFFKKPGERREAAAMVGRIIADPRPFFLFPLQLDSDSQIRFHSPYGRMIPAIEAVIESFARHAPAEARLILTEHPLDNGVVDLLGTMHRTAARAGVSERVLFLRNGSPEPLLRSSSGVVTVNSTIGFVALNCGVPVMTLGESIYDLPQLTYQGGLDGFWCSGAAADPASFDAFRRVVAARTQINGGLYSREARELAIGNICARLGIRGGDALPTEETEMAVSNPDVLPINQAA